MSSVGDKKVNDYLNSVCGLVKNKKVHDNIREELLSHIDELIEEKIDCGQEKERAIDEALSQMGDYQEIGKKLNKIHKASVDWILLAMTSALILFSITTFSYIQSNNIFGKSYGNNYVIQTLVYLVIGIVIALIALKIDYRVLKSYSKLIYAIAIVLSLVSLLALPTYYGLKRYIPIGAFSINIIEVAQIMFIIALAGIFDNYNWKSKKNLLIGLLIGFIPSLVFILIPSLGNSLVYTISVIVIMIVSGLRLKHLIAFIGTFILVFSSYIFANEYRFNRLLNLLFSFRNTGDYLYGYYYENLELIRNSSRLLGQGQSIAQNILPEANAYFIFVYIIYSFGWIVGISLLILILAFICRITFIGIKTKDRYGKLIVMGFSIIMGMQFLLSILINLSLAPYISVYMPFISFGGSNLVTNILVISIIISIYKWSNTPFIYKRLKFKIEKI